MMPRIARIHLYRLVDDDRSFQNFPIKSINLMHQVLMISLVFVTVNKIHALQWYVMLVAIIAIDLHIFCRRVSIPLRFAFHRSRGGT